MNKRITYTVEYNRNQKHWNVWKNIEYDKGTNFYSVFQGSKKDCILKQKELKKLIKN